MLTLWRVCSLEVGRGTIEIITKPCQTLQEIQDVHERAVRRMLVATSRLGLSVLGFGIQPVTEPSAALMAKRRRYNTLLRVIGDPWLLFTVTASDQVHIDVTEPELVRMINLGNLLSPLIVRTNASGLLRSGCHVLLACTDRVVRKLVSDERGTRRVRLWWKMFGLHTSSLFAVCCFALCQARVKPGRLRGAV